MTAPERADCPHCDPEHRDPTSRPWNVRVGPERDSDGQPVYLYAQPTNGAHVAESDAEWLWQLIRSAQSNEPTLTEYGQLMTDGGFHTRNPHPEIERVYPVVDWIKHGTRFGGRVFRRRVIVVEGWTEVTEP